jgi:hypothetical protein
MKAIVETWVVGVVRPWRAVNVPTVVERLQIWEPEMWNLCSVVKFCQMVVSSTNPSMMRFTSRIRCGSWNWIPSVLLRISAMMSVVMINHTAVAHLVLLRPVTAGITETDDLT